MSNQIKIDNLSGSEFLVTVTADHITTHQVTLDEDFLNNVNIKNLSEEQIIHKSFLFLLSKEPNTSILKKFNIEVIASYFPDFYNHFN